MTWQTILVPHDFSSSANHAAAIARDEAKLHGARIVLLHVIELPHQLPPDYVVMMPEPTSAPINVKDFAVRNAEEHLDDLTKRLGKDGVSVTPFIRLGHPVDEILQFAKEEKAGLIVMGTHGRTGLKHLLLGSVTERVVRLSEVPVLTIRHAGEG